MTRPASAHGCSRRSRTGRARPDRGRRALRERHDGPLHLRPRRARPRSSTWPRPTCARSMLNGVELDVTAYDAGTGRLPLPGAGRDQRAARRRRLRLLRTGEGLHRFVDPVDKEVYLYSQFETADAHRMYACFDQPDLKATFELTVSRPGALAGRLQHGARRRPTASTAATRRAAGASAGTSRRRRCMSTYITALVRRAVPRGARPSTTASRWACSAAQSLAAVPRRRRDLRGHPAGLRLLPRGRSASATRSASTTSSSCPSSTPARWRTRAA